MKNLIYVILAFLLFNSCSFKVNKTVMDDRTKKDVLIGKCNRNAFEQEDFKQWFQDGYNSYETDPEMIQKLSESEIFKTLKILVVFGTWCHDSRRELPRFYKIVDQN